MVFGLLALIASDPLVLAAPLRARGGAESALSSELVVIGRVLPSNPRLRARGEGMHQLSIFDVRVERVLRGKASGIIQVREPFGDKPFEQGGTTYSGTRYDNESILEGDHRYVLCLHREANEYWISGGEYGKARCVGNRYLPTRSVPHFRRFEGGEATALIDYLVAKIAFITRRESGDLGAIDPDRGLKG